MEQTHLRQWEEGWDGGKPWGGGSAGNHWHPSVQPTSAFCCFLFPFILQLWLVMADGQEDPAVFTSTCLPSDSRLLATVTNAYLGTRVYRNILHVSGVYNGAAGDTHRADIPSPVNVRMTVPDGDVPVETFTLNTRTGKEQCVSRIYLFLLLKDIWSINSIVHEEIG